MASRMSRDSAKGASGEQGAWRFDGHLAGGFQLRYATTMKWWISLLLVAGFVVPVLAAEPRAEATPESAAEETNTVIVSEAGPDKKSEPKVYIIPIREDIMPPLVYVVRRGVKEAMEARADAIILDMETNGGRVDITEEIIGIIGKFPGKKFTYVNRKAFSAGAFISFATEKIYMAPESVIGAAAPVVMGPSGPTDIGGTMEEKTTSAIAALVRASAEKNGHNVDVAEAMIQKRRKLEIDGEVVSEEGEILTLTNTEAEKKYGEPAKELLSAGTAGSIDDVIAKLGLVNPTIVRIEPSGVEKIARWVNAISPLLLMIGLAGLYIEYKTPGFGIFGIIGIVSFLIYFLGGYVAGLSGIEWVVLFALGIILLAIELFAFPGTIIIGMSGFGLIVISLIMAMADVYPGVPTFSAPGDFGEIFGNSLNGFFIGAFGSCVLIWLLSKWLPRTSYYSMLVSQSASGVESVRLMEEKKTSRIGDKGVAVSQLRPGGKARFGNDILDVISAGEIIESGREVKIVRHSGSDPVVEEIL